MRGEKMGEGEKGRGICSVGVGKTKGYLLVEGRQM